jgi:hypothetical protein
MKLIYQNEGSAEVYMKVMRSICGNVSGKSMLDVCCGEIPHTNGLEFSEKTFVDIEDRGGASNNPNFIQMDIFKFFKQNKKTYDVTISSDSIEHFRRSDAYELLHQMDLCSDKQIVFTPYGAHMIEKSRTDDPHSHKSAWIPEYFKGWAAVVFPNFHKIMNLGAFFVWTCVDIDEEFERVKNELNQIL